MNDACPLRPSPARIARVALLAVVTAARVGISTMAAQTPTATYRVNGYVHDESGRRIAAVELIVNRVEIRTRTDSAGRFSIGLTAADSTLGFRAIGYRPLLTSLRPAPTGTDSLAVELVRSAAVLPELITTAPPSRPVRYAGTAKYDDVFARRRLGFGNFLSREALDRKFVMSTPELLQGIPGIRVTIGPPGVERATQMRFSRCTESRGVAVFIDGTRQIPNAGDFRPEVEMLTRVNPADIEMIEIYRGAGEIPGVFHWDGCAVVALWTKWNR